MFGEEPTLVACEVSSVSCRAVGPYNPMTGNVHLSMADRRHARPDRKMTGDAPKRDAPTPEAVLKALDDKDCRAIVAALDEPLTAAVLSERCDIPTSTTYQKLDRLTEAELLEERIEVRPDGHHATQYLPAFESVEVTRDKDGLSVDIKRPARSADEQLASLWSEVQREL